MLAENAVLTAVMEPDREASERLREKYGAKHACITAEELLALDDVDAVYISSPVWVHEEQVVAAVRAGKHLLVEKPVATDFVSSRNALAVCDEAGIVAGAGLMMRFGAYHRMMRELVTGGKIGQIVSVRAQFTCWYPDMPGAWRQSKALAGGGALPDLGIHCMDLAEYITGSRICSVAAFCDTKTFAYDVDDSAALMLRLENGANAYIDVNFNIPDSAARNRLEFYGTGGAILAEETIGQIDGGRVEILLADSSAGYDAAQNRTAAVSECPAVEFGNMYTREIESLSDSVRSGAPAEVPLSDAVWLQRVMEAAYESAETGRRVDLQHHISVK